MAEIRELLEKAGNSLLESVKEEFLSALKDAHASSEPVIRETAAKVESYLQMRADGKINDAYLGSLIRGRRRVAEQFLIAQEIRLRANLDRISIGLLDTITEKFIGKIF